MRWITPRKTDIRSGTPGRIVMLVDVSGSMFSHSERIGQEIAEIAGRISGFRLFAFANSVQEVSLDGLQDASVGGGTNMIPAMRRVASLNPELTIILSDGYHNWDYGGEGTHDDVLRIGQAMTGAIYTFLCAEPFQIESPGPAQRLMIDLARIGRGKCIPIQGGIGQGFDFGKFRKALRYTLQPQHEKESPAMAKRRLDDVYLEDDEFEFVKPESVEIDMRRDIILHRGTRITEQWHEPQRQSSGGPSSQRIGVEAPQITVHEPQGVVRKGLFGWLTQPPQIEAQAQPQQDQYRGSLQEVPANYGNVPALPSPAHYAPALPAPARATQPVLAGRAPVLAAPGRSVPVLTDQRGGSMDTSMSDPERIAARFRGRG